MDLCIIKNEFIMPGDDLSELIHSKVEGSDSKFVIGPGLLRNHQIITAVKPGKLKTRDNPTVFWIDSHQRRVRICSRVANLFIYLSHSMSRLMGSE